MAYQICTYHQRHVLFKIRSLASGFFVKVVLQSGFAYCTLPVVPSKSS